MHRSAKCRGKSPPSAFVATVNEELTALFYRRQYTARVRESRAAV